MEPSSIILESKNRIATITLNRPEKRNALSDQLIAELQLAFQSVEADSSIKVVILKAYGPAFCAGADLSYLQKLQKYTLEENLQDSNRLKDLFLTIYQCPKLVIAQVNGHAIAGGCGLVSICDIAFSVDTAKFGYSEVKIGFLPALVMPFLVNKIGEGNARFLLLSGQLISAGAAQSVGLIHFVCSPSELEESVWAFAEKMVKENSGASIATTKKMLSNLVLYRSENLIDEAARNNAHARLTDDCRKGIQAFLDKSQPNW